MSQFNQKEWFYAVYMARTFLVLPPRYAHNITEDDLKNAAIDMLEGLLDRAEGNAPTISMKTKEIMALAQAEVEIELARTGGGLQ